MTGFWQDLRYLFSLLGVRALLGRTFLPGDDRAERKVVLIGAAADLLMEGILPRSVGDVPRVPLAAVSPDYFHALGTRSLKGRAFDAHDRIGTAAVVIVRETLARRFW